MTLQLAYNDFLMYQLLSGNTDKTIEYYTNCLKPFVNFIGCSSEMSSIGRDELRCYAVGLRKMQHLSKNSIKSYTKGIKSFLSWCYSEGLTDNNLTNFLPLPKGERKVVDILSDDEIDRLFRCFDIDTHNGLRNFCICSLMLDSGLRKSEVVNLKLSDVRWDTMYIIVNGKGSKQRVVPLGKISFTALCSYRSKYLLNQTSSFFLTQFGAAITDACLSRLFKQLKVQSGIPRLHAHLLRHTFATRYLMSGGNIYALQQILGHADLDIVQVYMHIAESQIIHDFARYSLLDKLQVGASSAPMSTPTP